MPSNKLRGKPERCMEWGCTTMPCASYGVLAWHLSPSILVHSLLAAQPIARSPRLALPLSPARRVKNKPV